MKRFFVSAAILAILSGCAIQTPTVSTTADVKACLTREAQARITDGSAMAAPIRTTVGAILNACLVPADQTPEARQTAQAILTALMQQGK